MRATKLLITNLICVKQLNYLNKNKACFIQMIPSEWR